MTASSVEPLPFKIPIEDIPPEHKEKCPTCGGLCVKIGKRYTRFEIVQKYRCRTCGTVHSNGPRRRYPQVIREYAKELYKKGLSLAEVAKRIEEDLSVALTRQIVLKWLVKDDIPRRQQKRRIKEEKEEIQETFVSPLQLLVNIQIRFTPDHKGSTPLIVTEFTDIIDICDPWEEI